MTDDRFSKELLFSKNEMSQAVRVVHEKALTSYACAVRTIIFISSGNRKRSVQSDYTKWAKNVLKKKYKRLPPPFPQHPVERRRRVNRTFVVSDGNLKRLLGPRSTSSLRPRGGSLKRLKCSYLRRILHVLRDGVLEMTDSPRGISCRKCLLDVTIRACNDGIARRGLCRARV